jgi:hypothetical protein
MSRFEGQVAGKGSCCDYSSRQGARENLPVDDRHEKHGQKREARPSVLCGLGLYALVLGSTEERIRFRLLWPGRKTRGIRRLFQIVRRYCLYVSSSSSGHGLTGKMGLLVG